MGGRWGGRVGKDVRKEGELEGGGEGMVVVGVMVSEVMVAIRAKVVGVEIRSLKAVVSSGETVMPDCILQSGMRSCDWWWSRGEVKMVEGSKGVSGVWNY